MSRLFRPALECLPDRILLDIAPLAPALPLVGPVGGVSPPAWIAVPLVPPLPGLPQLSLLPADLVRLQVATPINLSLGLVPLAPPVTPFPGGL